MKLNCKQGGPLFGSVKEALFPSHCKMWRHIDQSCALRYRYLGGYEGLNARASVEAAVDLNGIDNAFQDDYESVLRLRENLLLYFLHEGHPFVSGHYAFSKVAYEKFNEKYVFMTLLRNPVDRFFSSYFFNSRKDDDSPWKITAKLEEFIETRQAQNLGHDFVRLLGGAREDCVYDSHEAIGKAVENLRQFRIVGIIEQPNSIVRSIKQVLGVNIRVGHKNRNPVSGTKRKKFISEPVLDRVREICRPDVEVYNAAISHTNNDLG